MVPVRRSSAIAASHFPRIRGDGPGTLTTVYSSSPFSPYSRGWSRRSIQRRLCQQIFPVFAGMVLYRRADGDTDLDFPRIRGDGPSPKPSLMLPHTFSPYSRGWSRRLNEARLSGEIFPVFAGMVPRLPAHPEQNQHFPRIRGDGPAFC